MHHTRLNDLVRPDGLMLLNSSRIEHCSLLRCVPLFVILMSAAVYINVLIFELNKCTVSIIELYSSNEIITVPLPLFL